MGESQFLNVYSEIGKLKKVLVHRPGKEIENLTPELMERLLFDDIPFLEVARKEHDKFVELLEANNVEVYYLKDLLIDVLSSSELKEQFIDEFIEDTKIQSINMKKELKKFLLSFEAEGEMIDTIIQGIRSEEIEIKQKDTLSDYSNKNYQFITDPMPNLYLTRDPFSTIGNGVSMSHMKSSVRKRELIFSKYILSYHPEFLKFDIPKWYDLSDQYYLEGGDVAILNEKVLAVGISKRTEPEAIDVLAKRLLKDSNSFETILAFDIPLEKEFLHLDTVFTMIDHDKFIIHPDIEGPMKVYSIQKNIEGEIVFNDEHMTLERILAKYLQLDYVELIRCGGHHGIDASREQWSNATNALAIGPGKVVVNARNHVTNELLKKKGLEVNIISCSELSRGHGGPRCMALPLFRQ